MMIFIGLLERVMRRRCLWGLGGRRREQRRRGPVGMERMARRYVLFLLLLPSGASTSKSELDSRIGTKLTLQVKKTSSGNAFDDILYNSDSDLESDDDTPSGPVVNATRGKGPQASQTTLYQQRPGGKKDPKQKDKEPKKKEREGQSYIRGDGDEPLDLLSRSIAGNVASESGLSPSSLSSSSSSGSFRIELQRRKKSALGGK
jgi:hypothetical protein